MTSSVDLITAFSVSSRVTCPVCGKSIATNKNGKIARHGGGMGQACAGTGKTCVADALERHVSDLMHAVEFFAGRREWHKVGDKQRALLRTLETLTRPFTDAEHEALRVKSPGKSAGYLKLGQA